MMRINSRVLLSPWVWLTVFSLVYFFIRCTNLGALPIFTDEAIYIRWSQIGTQDAAWRYISLTDGKQPLYTWFVMAMLRIIDDPLIAGRMVSVVSGFTGLIGMYFLGSEIFGRKRIGILASFLYLISPFTLMYDRLAIYDSMVTSLSVWNLYIAVLLVRRLQLDIALIFGLSLGIGMLNKTSAFFSAYLLPVTLLLMNRSKKGLVNRVLRWSGFVCVAVVLSQAIYSILRLSPYFYIIAQKNTIFVYPLREWITHPFLFLLGNLHGEFDWLISYMSVPLFVAACLSVFVKRDKTSEKILLLIWWFAPFFALALFGKVLYPRFILFMTMPLFVLAAYSIDRVAILFKNRIVTFVFIAALCLPSLVSSYSIVFDIANARIPKSEIGQYINDWPSGWGVNEIVVQLAHESEQREIAVYTEGTFGLLPYALEVYLHNNPRIEIHGVWPPMKTIPENIAAKSRTKRTFYITNLTQTVPEWPISLVSEYRKGNNNESFIRLYEVISPDKK